MFQKASPQTEDSTHKDFQSQQVGCGGSTPAPLHRPPFQPLVPLKPSLKSRKTPATAGGWRWWIVKLYQAISRLALLHPENFPEPTEALHATTGWCWRWWWHTSVPIRSRPPPHRPKPALLQFAAEQAASSIRCVKVRETLV